MDRACSNSAGLDARPTPLRGRLLMRMGLEGKVVLCFSILLMAALAASAWISSRKTRDALSDILGEQAKQLSQTLAMAATIPYETNDVEELKRLGKDLIRSRNIVLVAFYSSGGEPLAVACRDPDARLGNWRLEAEIQNAPTNLMQVRHRRLPSHGEFLEVTAPVLDIFPARKSERVGPDEAGARLLGYLAIGVSQSNERAQMQRITAVAMAVGFGIFVLSLPLASGLIHRIFLPIRQLVMATKRIAAGEYDARVATDRPDSIGTLARAFNEMVLRIRQHEMELKVANESLAEANRSLEEKVQQRTLELESSNRRLSAEIAEKEDFLRAVSHDLNAPLRNIGGMATMLLMKHREQFDADIVHRLERICKNVEVETGLIAELLELSRIRTRRQQIESVEIAALVTEVAGLFEEDLKERSIELVVQPAMPSLLCERARFRQLFQNLIDNAIKYMGSGPERRISIGSRETEEGVEFFVSDTGIGIDPDDAQKVFYVFRRGKNTVEVNVPGKGVGLASVKSIIEMYEGRIWVESQVGQGSTFRFTIPARHVAPAPAGRIEQPPMQRGAA